ncbi:MAG: ParA family protein [Rudaea sp.]|uniref:ParA family protein n=1 Tax=unclassified Rudaea TaxID=2627037 RepID=UPI0010F4DD34|nr:MULTISPECIES: ParA family protein [unclassified Rudaea]MBN8884464.1 ParA family protein [Rudaea sp.]
MTRRVSVWSSGRGGAGKTTLSVNLAAGLAKHGLKVVLVDSDPQGGSELWHSVGTELGRTIRFRVARGTPSNTEDYDWIIYDHATGPRTVPLPAPLVIMPATADAVSLTSVILGRQRLAQERKRCLVVANRWRPDLSGHRAALQALGDVQVVRDRAVFPTAFSRGTSVYDEDAHLLKADEARAEIDALVKHVLSDGGRVGHQKRH